MYTISTYPEMRGGGAFKGTHQSSGRTNAAPAGSLPWLYVKLQNDVKDDAYKGHTDLPIKKCLGVALVGAVVDLTALALSACSALAIAGSEALAWALLLVTAGFSAGRAGDGSTCTTRTHKRLTKSTSLRSTKRIRHRRWSR